MSAVLTPRRPRRPSRAEASHQDSLFAAAAPAPATPATPTDAAPPPLAAAAPPASEAPEPAVTVRAHRQGPTLDDLVAGVWEGLLAGAPVDCPACGTVMSPRHSAGAGVVGGRCGGCGSSLS